MIPRKNKLSAQQSIELFLEAHKGDLAPGHIYIPDVMEQRITVSRARSSRGLATHFLAFSADPGNNELHQLLYNDGDYKQAVEKGLMQAFVFDGFGNIVGYNEKFLSLCE